MMFIVSKPLFRLRPDHRRINVDDGAMKIIRRHRTFLKVTVFDVHQGGKKFAKYVHLSFFTYFFAFFSRSSSTTFAVVDVFIIQPQKKQAVLHSDDTRR